MAQHDTLFISSDGEILVMDVKRGESHLYSPDGNLFYEILGKASDDQYFRRSVSESGTFQVPELSINASFKREDSSLVWRGDTYTWTGELFIRDNEQITGLPTSRVPEYLALSADASLVLYVTASEFRYSYESFRLFVGDGEKMREINIQRTTRDSDGGTTTILTDEGVFYTPTPYEKGSMTTWLDTQMFMIYRGTVIDNFDVIEDDTGKVTSVTRKS